MRLSARPPPGSVRQKFSAGSPPSPLLLRPPIRFMATASTSWASGERAPRHGRGHEAREDGLDRLHLLAGDGLPEAELQEIAQDDRVAAAHELGVFAVGEPAARP